jgi:transcriptional regulator with XRE-family HTH domain
MTPAELRAWRLSRGLTLPAAAAVLGITKSTLVRYEQGRLRINPTVAKLVAVITPGLTRGE